MKNNKIQQNKYKQTLSVVILLLAVILIILLINKPKQNTIQKIALGENALEVGGETLDISRVISTEPNPPTVGAGMIPIKWDGAYWVITNSSDLEWYNYANGKWANVMLSDGYYKSELQAGIDGDRVAEKNIGAQVKENELGSIFTWIPRLAYLEDRVEFLKNTNVLDYMWTTEECFNLEKYGANYLDLGFEGIWIGQTEFANETEIENKNIEMQQEQNKEGLIANEQVTTLTSSEKTVAQKLQTKYSVGQNKTMLQNIDTMNLRQVIKIVNTNKKLPIVGTHVVTGESIIIKSKYSENGIKYVTDKDGNKLENNTSPISDEEIQYTFYIIDNLGNIRRYKMYHGKPYLKGFNKNTTFYVTYNEQGEEDSSIPIGEKAPSNWYNYENQQWANIVCRDNGGEAYYTWIPRYMYKIRTDGSETVDAKFVDLENVYTDPKTGRQYDLNKTDYKLPEAFTWEDPEDSNSVIQLPGYWLSKYKLSATSSYYPDIVNVGETIRVNYIIENIGSGYTYEMYLIEDGKRIVYDEESGKYIEGTEPIKLTGNYTFTNVPEGNYAVNIIVKDSAGKHVRAVSRQVTIIKSQMDIPDVTGFRVDTTYIVTYDESGNENHTQTIQSVLKDGAIIKADNTLEQGEIDVDKINGVWYDYPSQKWANIVTINNGRTAYYTWIPRYEYKLDTASQKTNAILIPKTKETPDAGYQIPEAFTWEDPNDSTKVIQLSGYWLSKYKLSS